MEIDSLVISLGLDPARLREGLGQVQAALVEGRASLADFVQGIQEGFQEALQEVAQGGSQAAGAVDAAGEAAEEAGERFRDAGKRGAEGMEELSGASGEMARRFEQAVGRFSDGVDRLGNKAQQAANKARQAGSEVQAMGRKIGGFLRGIVSTVAAPLAGALSAGAIMGSYFSDVAQMAEQTGRYSKQLEEARKKKALLARVNKEDVELYRKGKLALLDFDFAMAGLSATIMRALSPAIRFGIGLLNSMADWVRRNEPNIIRFITVLAGTITAALIPSFYKLARAMLMNPLTWIIAGILLLAIVIDDLVTYIRGGNSQFAALWSQFGTGEEIMEKLRRVWEAVLRAFEGVKEYLPNLFGAAAGVGAVAAAFKTWAGIGKLIHGITGAVRGLGVAMAANPIGAIIMLIAAIAGALLPVIIEHWDDIKNAFGKAADWVYDKWQKVLQWFTDKIDAVAEKWKKVKEFFGMGSESSEKADAVAQAAKSGDKEAQEVFDMANTGGVGPLKRQSPVQPGAIPSNEDFTRAGVPASATVNNTRNQQIDARYTTNVYAPGADPQAMADAFGNQMQRQTAQLGTMAADGGVRQ